MADTVEHNEEHDRRELGHDAAVGHETSDVNTRVILGFIAALVLSLVLTILFVAWLFGFYVERANEQQPPAGPLAEQRKQLPTPSPRLQVSSTLDMQALREKQNAALRETAWIDRGTKHARIPIDDAIDIVVQRGLPDWPPVTTDLENEATKLNATTKETKQTKAEQENSDG